MNLLIDPAKIAQLQDVLGGDFQKILGELVESMEEGIGQIEQALSSADLAKVAWAAHRCRNDALMVQATAMLRALEQLEQAARDDRLAEAQAAMSSVAQAWPPARAALEEMLRS